MVPVQSLDSWLQTRGLRVLGAVRSKGRPVRRAWPPVSEPSWDSQYSGGLKSGMGCVFLLLRRTHFFLPLPLLPVPSSVCFGRSLDRRAGRLVHGFGGGMGTGWGAIGQAIR